MTIAKFINSHKLFVKQGSFTHQDFAGHKGTIRPGDVQVYFLSTLLNFILLDIG